MTFRSLGKFLAAPLAIVALTGAFFHGDRFSITFPDNWSPGAENETSKGLFESFEHKGTGAGANCNVQTLDLATLAKLTQQEINAENGHAFSQAEWADLLGLQLAQVTVVTSEIHPAADTFFHVTTLRLKVETKDIALRYGFYILPGRITMAGCYAPWTDYATYSAVFETTIDSLRPW
jgi:hypothetical protein